ncbi:MAG: phosphotransferase [Burkholderiaceae bacterium]|jgi:aminoglycoside/choline kinase family phosphotransferase|nr:phosphotransferase [Burkholderiaceae bacterium]
MHQSVGLSHHGDPRLLALRQWLDTLSGIQFDSKTLRPASSDASFRRYFRVDSSKGSLIVMDAPPDKEPVQPFLHVAEVFRQIGVSVPDVIAAHVGAGFLLLSDLGAKTYLQELSENSAHALYMDAIDSLIRIQSASVPGTLPEYDRTLLLRELSLFPEWFIAKHVQVGLSDEQKSDLSRVFDLILSNNLAQQPVYVHRDYHSRNLMVTESGNPGILDFQDAVYGPLTYDLVSLLRDAYIVWDEERVLDWVIRYWERARRAGLPVPPDIDAFYRDFEFMGVQRHLKILGIFSRLYYRDGKAAYLNDLPVVLAYVTKVLERYKELSPLRQILDPLLERTPQVGYTF